MNFENVKELITMFDQSNIKEMKLEKGDLTLFLVRDAGGSAIAHQETSISEPQSIESLNNKEQIMADEDFYIVKAPLVGVFYAAPSPEDKPYVQTGDKVSPESILCIIEAMKIMNEIEADVHGDIIEILVNNGDIVEAGQPIMKIRRQQ